MIYYLEIEKKERKKTKSVKSSTTKDKPINAA